MDVCGGARGVGPQGVWKRRQSRVRGNKLDVGVSGSVGEGSDEGGEVAKIYYPAAEVSKGVQSRERQCR